MNEFIKKLIEKLEEEHEICVNRYGIVGGNLPAAEVKRCMEIVTELAEEQNNDVCEWKRVNSNRYDCLAHAESHDSRVLDWCVCPYCGKEIKVIGD